MKPATCHPFSSPWARLVIVPLQPRPRPQPQPPHEQTTAQISYSLEIIRDIGVLENIKYTNIQEGSAS